MNDRTKTALQKVAGVYIQASQSQTTGTKGSPVIWLSGNSGNMEYGFIKPSKIQTFSPNSAKESLKWSKESTLNDPWCSHRFFAKLKHRGSKVCISGKNGAPKSVGWA